LSSENSSSQILATRIIGTTGNPYAGTPDTQDFEPPVPFRAMFIVVEKKSTSSELRPVIIDATQAPQRRQVAVSKRPEAVCLTTPTLFITSVDIDYNARDSFSACALPRRPAAVSPFSW
jgi:hypothetical protein